MLDSDLLRLKTFTITARQAGVMDELPTMMAIEMEAIARRCMGHMLPMEVRAYCHKLNRRMDGFFSRTELDGILARFWEDAEAEIGRSLRTRPAAHLSALEEEVRSWGENYGFTFGIQQLDGAWGGLMPGELGVVVGAQGSMKTSLAVKGVTHFLQSSPKGSVLFFSLDMTAAELSTRFMLLSLGVSLNELYGMMRERHPDYLEAKSRLDEWEAGRLKILGNTYKNRWTIDGVEAQAAMKLPSVIIIDFLTCLKRPGQSDLEAVEEIMPRLQGITQELGVKTLLLSQMSRASKSDQLKGAVGGHSKGGGIIEELAHAEIELLRDAPSAEGEGHKIIATVTKTRRGISGASFSLDYRGRSMEFTGRSQRVERNKDRKPMFSIVNALRG